MPVAHASRGAESFTFLALAENIYLHFRAGGERYAVPVTEVSEIGEPEAVRRVPGAASPVAGVMDLRGRIVTVLDVFDVASGADGRWPQAIVFHEPLLHLGLFVPAGVETLTLPGGADRRAREADAPDAAPWVGGAFQHEGRLYSVLSAERLAAFARLRLIESFKH